MLVDVSEVFYTTQVIRENLGHINVHKNCGTAKAFFFLSPAHQSCPS